MSTQSEDVTIRCKTCGRQIENATATVRANDSSGGHRIVSQAKFLMGRLQCERCAAASGKR